MDPKTVVKILMGVAKRSKDVAPEDLLMALHNTRPDRLAKANELGGFAVPSIAITKPSQGFNSFGDISLIGDASLVKPSRTTPVFGSDVYSPRFPSTNDEGTRIFRGFTDLGNRRYAPLTLDNLVREMKGNIRGGESFNYGAGSVRAAVTPQFSNLKDIQSARGNIVSNEQFRPMKEAANSELIDLAYKFHPYSKYSGNGFQHADDFSSMLAEYYRQGLRPMNDHYKNLPPELLDNAKSFMTKLRNMPTEYFEAKPQRGVGINEFKAAVVPAEEMKTVAPILEKHGINRIEQYPERNNEARIDALKKLPDLMFGLGAGGVGVGTLQPEWPNQ